MKSVAGAQISPDGRYVAYTVQQANWDENDFYTQIWIAMPCHRRALPAHQRQEIFQRRAVVARFAPPGLHQRPRWQAPDLPDLARRRRSRAVDRRGERRRRHRLVARRQRHRLHVLRPGRQGAQGPQGKVRRLRNRRRRLHHESPLAAQTPRRVARPIPKKLPKPEPLTKGDAFSVGAFSWSPDGKRIAFSASRDPDLGLRRYRDLLRPRPGRSACQEAARIRRPERQPQVVARRQRDRLHHLQRPAVLLLRQPLPGRDPRRGRPAAPAHARTSTKTRTCSTGDRTASISPPLRRPPPTSSASIPRPARSVASAGPTPSTPRGASFTKDHRTLAATGAAPNHFPEIFVSSVSDFAPQIPHRRRRPVQGFPPRHARSGAVEIQGRRGHRRHPDQARRLRPHAEVPAAGGDPRRAHRRRYSRDGRRPLLTRSSALPPRGRSSSSRTIAAPPATARNSARSTCAISASAITTT